MTAAEHNPAGKPVDVLGHMFTPQHVQHMLDDEEEGRLFRNIGRGELPSYTVDEFRSYAAEQQLGRMHVVAFQSWSYRRQQLHLRVTPDEIAPITAQLPGLVYGLFGVNPHDALRGVREMEQAVTEFGFVGMHIHPHGFDLGPDHSFYFPYYAKCVELGIPAMVSMGHTMEFMPIESGRPARLDRVALYFPELTLVCNHTGWPWVEEAIALASKHPNVYLGATAYAPKYWKPEMVRFINSYGRDKVIWGSDFPTTNHIEQLQQIDALELREESRAKLLWGNAEKIFDYAAADRRIANMS